ncbi:MAG: cell division protein FtsZ [Inquilinus sp.]|nr:cell division protein FtsZ [Inquilinus sp.]
MINLSIPQSEVQLRPRITVVGVGGAGGNAVNNMIQSSLEGCEFLVANTDAQALSGSMADRKLQLGTGITQGLGAGSRPDIGRASAEEALEEMVGYLDGSHMVFITAGMGGGTGTGAAPVIARAAREQNILTVGVVTKPFHFEGAHRMRVAEAGLNELQQYVDTLIVIPNQNLFRIANERTTFADAFKMADEVLSSGVRGVTDLMVMPGLINLDFADIRTVMAEMGKAMMGAGEAEGERRAVGAAEAAISNPLLDDVSMKGARGVLINITGGLDMTLYEVDEAINRVRDEVDADANIIFGSTFDESMEGQVRVSVVATGIDLDVERSPRGTFLNSVSAVGTRSVGAPAECSPLAQPAAGAVHTAPHAPEPAPFAAEPAYEPEPATGTAAAEAAEPPRGEVRDGAFIAPQPVAAPARTATLQPRRAADPFAEADLANAGPGRRRGTNIFKRMTGLLREDEAQNTAPAAPVQPEPTAAAPHAAPPAQPAQPRLSGLDVGRRGPLPSAEDDQLDIPAFLRRQAN